MRIAVTGRTGQLATSLAERAAGHPGIEVVLLGRPDLDLERPETVAPALTAARPDLVVNAAAYTAVDKAESEEARATAVNGAGAGQAAAAAWQLGLPFIQMSTDYVYPGDKPSPYVETDPVGPLGAYGRSKLAGERAVAAAHPQALIFRTAWVYSPVGANFVRTMLRVGRERPVLSVVGDQLGNPTSALDLADAILRIAPELTMQAPGGIYHLAGEGHVSWHGFAEEIFRCGAALGGPVPELRKITTAEYPTPARRPANSRLDTTAFRTRFGFCLRPWPEALCETVGRLLAPGQQRT